MGKLVDLDAERRRRRPNHLQGFLTSAANRLTPGSVTAAELRFAFGELDRRYSSLPPKT
jgi:hypothetical protein